ncbi:MAG: hypothetical protein KAR06_01345 [Deltaproteobacteria bacterium]|nr:hypothetical protein [Deltaproteobacteria bacterium]
MIKLRVRDLKHKKVLGYEWCDEAGWHCYYTEMDIDKAGTLLRIHPGVLPAYEGQELKRQRLDFFCDIPLLKEYQATS